jgi:two-component system, chemotaxis family, chemotaxis protein CheY
MDKKKLLLVEDSTETRNLYQEVLEEANFLVDAAADGKEGLDKARIGGYDLLIMDIMLPKLDGLSIMTELKNNPPQNPNGKVVVLTNLEHDSVVNECLQLGAVDYIVKSNVNPGELVEKIKGYLV